MIPSTVKSIIFTDIDIAIDATLIDVDDDGDGGVVAWVDTSDNTKMYVSTQYAGIKVEGNTNSSKLFYNNSNITELNLSNLDTSNVKDMSYMFSGCVRLSKLIDFNLNTNSATDMRAMFYNCSKLTSLDLSSFNTNKVSYMDSLFTNCHNLTTIKVGNKFKWITTLNKLGLVDGTWQDEDGKQYVSTDTFPSNVAHTYTKVS